MAQTLELCGPVGRRTISVHHDETAARAAAHNMIRLWNGTPCGHSMLLWPRMGKVALVTVNHEALLRHARAATTETR